jgi:hypothetical protein
MEGVMGVYDTLGDVQLKCGYCEMRHFEIGDDVTDAGIADGVYVGYGGVVVVKNGKFIGQFEYLIDKWGTFIEPEEVINRNNPISVAVDRIVKEQEDKNG